MLGKMFKMMKKGNKGFTLVELMVVVVIIGVLTAIAVPVYNNVTAKAKINAIAANLRIINGAISQYQTDKGTQPTGTDDLDPDYIQEWPGTTDVTYQIGNSLSGDDAEINEDSDDPIQGYAKLSKNIGTGDTNGVGTLVKGTYPLATVQDSISE